ncbi:MAG: hypothetical protein LBS37_03940, partial [Treponema sp.]|nr:hypothetical protein [Treponema sp.]
ENALPVDDLNLTFYVPAPETGGIPALSLAGPQYTGVVSWSSGSGPHNGVFWPGTAYTATVTMQAASGRTFNGVGQNAFRHWTAGAAVSNEADSGVVRIVFPATGPGEPVSSIDLTAYIRRPVITGERTTIFRTAVCYGTVEWEVDGAPMPDGFFRMDKVYTAKVTLFPVLGYVFSPVLTVIHTKADTVTMGATNPVQAAVSIVFPKTGKIVPIASGGEVSIAWTGVPGYYYEIHTFRAADTVPAGGQAAGDNLVFTGAERPSTIEVMVVAGGGGGGGGGSGWTGSGGGGGGVVYHPAFKVGALENWTTPGTITVKVGAGGSGGVGYGSNVIGGNGGDSAFVRHSTYQINAKGGGGGGGGGKAGANGGSGGGSHNSFSIFTLALAGTVPAESGVLNLGSGGHPFIGGGAGEDGASANWGRGFPSSISGESRSYAAGGMVASSASSGTGDGGGGGVPSGMNGSKGGSGIVIVRFIHPGDGS